jgi:hypothetical protein
MSEKKPTSKVIQICVDRSLVALCEDGSIWLQIDRKEWECILESFKPLFPEKISSDN